MIPAPVRTAERFESVVISPEATIAEGLRQLERAGTGALLLCESDRTFVGLLTDGDVRRAILASIPFSRPCRSIAKIDPVVAPADIDRVDALRLMDHAREFVLDQLPLVDDRGRAVGLLLRSDVVTVEDIELSAVIMAGGFGKRLLPLTEHTPKPMLPIGDRPLLEHTISRLRDAGIRRVAISTHHLADRITDHFGDGNAFGVNLQYMSEDQPLGTAGALRLMGDIQEPVLVINGDILTGLRFQDMAAHHHAQRADITVGLRRCELEIPYGVVDTDGDRVCGVREKPKQTFLINAGVYLIEPHVYQLIPEGQRFDMTDLIQRLIDRGRRVVGFPIVEYWLDIGRPADYEQAQLDVKLAGLEV